MNHASRCIVASSNEWLQKQLLQKRDETRFLESETQVYEISVLEAF